MMTSNSPNMSSDRELNESLARFENSIDETDPEQKNLLESIREHTRQLQQLRGVWNKNSTDRCWNDPAQTPTINAPHSVDSYRYIRQRPHSDCHL